MSLSKRILLCLCFCLSALAARAQYRFDSWTTDNGLPQNSVFSILQTPDGYIWFTTLDGLVRFDGIRFKVFNRSNSPGLTTNRLLYLLAENDDTILVGTEDGGLLRFRNGQFRAFTTADGLPSVKVNKIFKDSDGNLLASAQEGLARFDGQKFVLENRLDARDYALYFAPSGVRWELSQGGLTAAKDGQIVKYDLPFEINKISADRTFNYPNYAAMLEDKNHPGVLWLTAAANLYRLENGSFTAFSKADGMPESLVRAIAQDAEGNVWLGTEDDGLCRFVVNRVNCYTTADGFSGNSVWSVFIDREKTLWAATGERGIIRVTQQAIKTLSKKDGLLDNNIYPLLEDGDDGGYWIGAFSALSHYKDGKITNFTRRNGLLYEIVQSLFKDNGGRLWIGSVGGVEYLENGRFVDFTGKLGLPIGDFDFWDIYQTASGAMWFATSKGLIRYENGSVQKFTVENGLPSNDVKKILARADGTLWFGTLGGLARFDGGGAFDVFTEKDGLPANHVRTIYEDAEDLLWVGTYDGGLSLFREGKFTNITIENGLFSNGVFQILEDGRGNFWMSSNQGIYRVSRRQLIDFADGKTASIVSTAFGKSDGMLNTECNGGRQPAGIKTKDGKLWFPTQDGVAIVDPEAVPFNPLPPPVVIEAIRIDNVPTSPARVQTPDDESQNPQSKAAGGSDLIIQPGQENLEIDYAGLSFIKSEQVRFRYRLEGLDEDWTEAGTRRTAFYPYLPPGNYTFRVAAANSDNVWSERDATLSIIVEPPFYQRGLFILGCVAVVLFIMYGIYRARVSRLERARLAQEEFSRRLINAHESERRRIAAGLHDSLGQQLLVIKNWAMLELNVLPKEGGSREALGEISEAASQAVEEVREIIYDLRPYQLDKIGLKNTIRFMVEKIAAASGVEFTTDIGEIDRLFSPEAEIALYRIVQECVNNIIKHSGATRALVVLERGDRVVNLAVEDNGRGFNLKNEAGKSPEENQPKRGFGLEGLAERVRILGGTLSIKSAPDDGTKIYISIEIDDAERK